MKRRVKRRYGIFVAVLALVMLFPLTAVAKEKPTDICNNYEWEVLKIVNRERMNAKLQPLSTCKKLQSACDVRATELASSFSHTRPNGKSCFTVLDEKKMNYGWAGENIATGQGTPAYVMQCWMNSSGHKANILNVNFDHCGVGYGTKGYYGNSWVQLFTGGCSPTSIKVAGPISSAKPGMSIDDMNLYLEIKCSDSGHSVSYCPIISKMCSNYSKSKTCSQIVTVKYQGMKTTFNVGKIKNPAQVTKVKKKAVSKNSISISWKKVSCTGYDVAISKVGSEKYKIVKTYNKETTTSSKITNLKAGTSYYIKVRAFYKINGDKKSGKWSKAIKVKTLSQ